MEDFVAGYVPVDISRWARKEHFEAFQSSDQCTFSQTVQLDITARLKCIKKRGDKFYPTMIYLIARLLNAHAEFRMAIKDGELVTWDVIHPSYTVFHEKTETFSSLWSRYCDDILHFQTEYANDMAHYRDDIAYLPRALPDNVFFLSANPWVSFTSFELNLANFNNVFSPIFTLGKYYVQDNRVLMPLAVQVHHAVCDGFHVGRLLNELQMLCDDRQWPGQR